MTAQVSLTAEDARRFEPEGYLVVTEALAEEHLEPIRRVMERTVEHQATEWLEQGLIADACAEESLWTRYGSLRKQLPATFSNSWRRILVSPQIYAVWQYPPLIYLMRPLLGDELYASTIWNGRPRASQQRVQTVDWHQDAQYMQECDPVKDRAVSAWIPLVPVDEHSGCLQVIPGSHTRGLRPGVRVERNNLLGLGDDELAGMEPVSCVMDPGDVLLFSELIYHRSLENVSDYTRWSLDVRYFDAANQALSAKETERYRGDGLGACPSIPFGLRPRQCRRVSDACCLRCASLPEFPNSGRSHALPSTTMTRPRQAKRILGQAPSVSAKKILVA